ncbi:hypothetical protein BC833DRAFT_590228 [Globomyces pollinis-pini]|nr:hypothetical protein BC833DRAFT_590228 [Globomyces pollinis-pini]
MAAYRTFLGTRVWPGNYLKLYFPFIITGTTSFFLFANVHTKLMNAPDGKWEHMMRNVSESTAAQKNKNDAVDYYFKKDKH